MSKMGRKVKDVSITVQNHLLFVQGNETDSCQGPSCN